MKSQLVNNIYLAMLTLCLASCQKSTIESVQKNADVNKTDDAKTSSVLGYYKDNTTSVATIDATPGYTMTVMYSVGPLTVQAGDVVSVHFQQRLTYSGSDAVMTASGVIVTDSPTSTTATIGRVVKNAGSNMTPEELGMEVISRTGSYQFTAAASNVYINAICYGANLSGNPPGAVDITVPANSGELVAVLENGVTRYSTMTMGLPVGGSESKPYCAITNPITYYTQYSLGPYSIPANTMVDCRLDLAGTTDPSMPVGNYNMRLGRYVSQETSSTGKSGTRLFPAIQTGATHGEHHIIPSHAAGMRFASSASGVYFNSTTYAAGWISPGNPFYVEQPNVNNYGHYIIEMRPSSSSSDFAQDVTRNFTTPIGYTKQVLYSVGPIDIAADQVVEIRYQVGLSPNMGVSLTSSLIRATSPTATTGTVVQPGLNRRMHPYYVFSSINQSTAERPSTALTGQYYNVVVGSNGPSYTCPTQEWGELEVIKR